MKKNLIHPKKESKKHDAVTSALLTELPFEDSLWLFWRKYNRQVTLGIALIILGFLGFQGVEFYKTSQVKALQEDYRAALKEGHELAFAEANIDEPLAGEVFLSTGDQFVNDSKYDDALANYKKALISLKSTPFGDRTRLGIALVTWMKGDQEASKKLLSELVNDYQVVGAIRAEAAYQMALISLKEGDYVKSKDFIDTINHIPNAGIWGQKANILRDSTPGLSDKA